MINDPYENRGVEDPDPIIFQDIMIYAAGCQESVGGDILGWDTDVLTHLCPVCLDKRVTLYFNTVNKNTVIVHSDYKHNIDPADPSVHNCFRCHQLLASGLKPLDIRQKILNEYNYEIQNATVRRNLYFHKIRKEDIWRP
jgi:hypothetical protein